VYACWTVKGGSGSTVFAAALALELAGRGKNTTIIDFGGDVPSVLGLAEPAGRGVRDWLADQGRQADELHGLGFHASKHLRVIPAGSGSSFDGDALHTMCALLDHNSVVDFGTLRPPDSVRKDVSNDWLVIRPCYLALRRASRLTDPPKGVVVIKESWRALTSRDIQAVVGAPVVAEITVCDTVARSVDAGLLATKLPKRLSKELESLK